MKEADLVLARTLETVTELVIVPELIMLTDGTKDEEGGAETLIGAK